MKNYKELVIWQRGIEIVKKIYELVKQFPQEEKYGIVSQITRTAVSIPANIAEGSSKQSDKDYARFVQHSLGSAFEVQTYLIIAQEMNWIDGVLVKELEDVIEREIMMLHRFLNTLNSWIRDANSERRIANSQNILFLHSTFPLPNRLI